MLLLLLAATSFSTIQEEQSTPAPEPTRLVVMLSVDQMIPEQFDRLGPELSGGLGRLFREGMVYRNARLDYARTETGPGHVTYATGCLPRTHGVVGNGFWDRTLGREQYCVEDEGAFAVRSSGPVKDQGRRSPRNLRRATLAEMMQKENPGCRVLSISSKDRAAIGLAGRAKGTVLWWDKLGAGFQTSNFYADALPEFVSEWNAGWEAVARGWVWEPIQDRTEAELLQLGAAADERDGERPMGTFGVTFPYAVPADATSKSVAGFAYQTPLCDQFVVELARAGLGAAGLGTDDVTDLLCLSFSTCDVVGHANGPYSREVTDVLLRLDAALDRLFADLDETVGEGRWVATLTADHGVLPLPEALVERGVPARRVTPEEVKAFRGEFIEELSQRLGGRVRHRSGPSGYYLDADDLNKIGGDPVEARKEAADVIRGLRGRFNWVQAAYSYEELLELGPDAVGIERMLYHSFDPERTIDLVVIHRPFMLVGMAKGTSHGTPYDYDRHVPMILFGAPFPKGSSSAPVGSHDIVPTLMGRLGIAADAPLDGRDLMVD